MPGEEAIFEGLEAQPLLDFSSLSGYCFTPAGDQVMAIFSCPKFSRLEISRGAPVCVPSLDFVMEGGGICSGKDLSGCHLALDLGQLPECLFFQMSVRGQATVAPKSIPFIQTLKFCVSAP